MLIARRRGGRVVVRSLIVSAVVLLLAVVRPPPLHRAALAFQGFLYAFLPPRDASPLTCVVAVDARSADRYGPWPWRPGMVKRLVAAVARGGPRVIGIDPCAGGGGAAGWAPGVSAAGAAGAVVGYGLDFSPGGEFVPDDAIASSRIVYITNPWGEVRDYPAPRAYGVTCLDRDAAADAAATGFVTIDAGAGAISREVPLVARAGEGVYRSFVVAVAGRYRGALRLTLKLSGGTVRGIDIDGEFIPTRRDGCLPIREYARGVLPVFSAADVIEGRIDPGAFRHRAVIIGGAPGETGGSSRPAPSFGAKRRLVIQATAVENILRDQYLRESPLSRLVFFGLVMAFPPAIPLLLSLRIRRLARITAPLALCAFSAGFSAVFVVARSEQVLFFYPLLGALASWAVCGAKVRGGRRHGGEGA